MNRHEMELLSQINDWKIQSYRIERLQEQVDEMNYRVTQKLSHMPAATLKTVSKVEVFSLKELMIKNELKKLKKKRSNFIVIFKEADLDSFEKILICHLMDGYNLQDFAKEYKYHYTYIYKLRDKAIHKLYLTGQRLNIFD